MNELVEGPVTSVRRTTVGPAGAPAAHRAVRLLELLAEQRRPVTVTAAARALDLPKSSVTYLLASLAETGMVRHHPSGWLLGYKILELNRALLSSSAQVAAFRRYVRRSPLLEAETCVLATLDGRDIVYVDRHDGGQPVRFINEVGSRNAAVTTSLGRAMLAQLPDDEVKNRFVGVELPQPTPESLPDLDALLTDLAAVRRRGSALDSGQGVAGVGCVGFAAPGVATPLAVSVSLLRQRLDRDLEHRLAEALRELAQRLTDTD